MSLCQIRCSTKNLPFFQATLNFNPASMLPGAAPPVKEPEPIEIGFDVPAEAKTLSSANKVGIAHMGQKGALNYS